MCFNISFINLSTGSDLLPFPSHFYRKNNWDIKEIKRFVMYRPIDKVHCKIARKKVKPKKGRRMEQMKGSNEFKAYFMLLIFYLKQGFWFSDFIFHGLILCFYLFLMGLMWAWEESVCVFASVCASVWASNERLVWIIIFNQYFPFIYIAWLFNFLLFRIYNGEKKTKT